MAKFKPAKITSQGQLMMMQDLNNQIDLQFTRIAFGNGEYTEKEYSTISARTALKSQKQAFNIGYKLVKNGTSLELGVVASNESLTEGYSITEVGLFARDRSDENSVEKLYAIVIADTEHVVHYKSKEVYDENSGYYVPVSTDEIDYEEDVVLADYMPAYNGTSPVRIAQKFQVDVSDASSVTIEFVDGSVVPMSYLEEFYYNKAQTNALLGEKMNYEVLDTVSTISALNEIATDSEYADGNFTLIIPIGSGNIMANLDIAVCETAVMTFHGDYPILYFPYNNKTFRYSESVTNKWARVYADVNPTDSVIAGMINARHPKPKHLCLGRSIYEATLQRSYAVNGQSEVGRLYISGTDAVEYVDLESTEGVELINTDSVTPSSIYYIQTWHKFNGEVTQRYKVGATGEWSEWAILSPATT
jgi:hypothetical protein